VALIPISNKERRVNSAAEHLRSVLARRGITASIHQGLWLEAMPRVAAENDLIIYLVVEAGFQTWNGSKTQNDTWTYGMAGREKTVVISLDNPFHSDEFAAADTYINAYDASDVVIAALARGMFGEITFTGKSPVNLTMFRCFDIDAQAFK
jgi:hypothetical protein